MKPNVSAKILRAIAERDSALFWIGVQQMLKSEDDLGRVMELALQSQSEEGQIFLAEQLSLLATRGQIENENIRIEQSTTSLPLENPPQIETQRANVVQSTVSSHRTCRCCIEECESSQLVACYTGNESFHEVCYDCIQKNFAEPIARGQIPEFLCFADEHCNCPLNPNGVEQALSSSIQLDNLKRRIREEEIAKAMSKDQLPKCPFCQAIAGFAEAEGPNILCCENNNCLKVSCLSCQLEEHPTQSCDEAKQLNAASALDHRINEARSEAAVSGCPKCKLRVQKDGGCNHLTCPNCKTDWCHLCNQTLVQNEITTHFQGYGGVCASQDTELPSNYYERKVDEAGARAASEIAEQHPDRAEEARQYNRNIHAIHNLRTNRGR